MKQVASASDMRSPTIGSIPLANTRTALAYFLSMLGSTLRAWFSQAISTAWFTFFHMGVTAPAARRGRSVRGGKEGTFCSESLCVKHQLRAPAGGGCVQYKLNTKELF
jgi:hypothetical protein